MSKKLSRPADFVSKNRGIFILLSPVAALIATYFIKLYQPQVEHISFEISLLSLLIMIIIFFIQADESQRHQERTDSSFEMIAQMIKNNPSDPTDIPEELENNIEGDEVKIFESRAHHEKDGNLSVGNAADAPLSVLADLVNGWRKQELDGSWRVYNLQAIARKRGKGNHPWYFLFKTPSGKDELWQVSRGGQGKREATVTKLPIETQN